MEGARTPSRGEVFRYFFGLGFVNIGGPVAQITMLFQGIVERRRWLDRDRFVRIMGVCHVLPGPEALQLAIYVGYLTGRTVGGIIAGLTFILPGAVVMTVLAWGYVAYGALPAVNDVLDVLKPAVLGIIAAGLVKIGRAALTDARLIAISGFAFLLLALARVDLLIVMALAGLANVASRRTLRAPPAVFALAPLVALTPAGWLDFIWVFLKTGLFSFGGAYGSIAFLQQGAVAEHGWLTASQLLDGVALSVATPGPFMLFATFAGYLAAGVPGAAIATVAVFLPSFVLVLGFARWIERALERPAFREAISGISAAVVAVILTVTIALAPAAVTGPLSVAVVAASFTAVTFLKRDVAQVAAAAMVAGLVFALARALS
ncbi:MAG TPA: chromate efflux transporter [Candidatus Limnocylindria bacterium]